MQTEGNINFVLVGARATGKTVYLASLFLNSKCVTAEGQKAINYLKPLANALEKGNYPSATSGNLHEIKFNYKDENFNSSIQIDDVDGHFIETLSELDEHTQTERDKFIQNLELSEGIIFFFPYEKQFNEEAIKEFNYQIDTIVSKLKKIYLNSNSLPIPAVIAVSKWDDSPDYKSREEEQKVLEYIDSKKFLRLAKEKIEVNFNKVQVVPLSATGTNMNHLEPYNLEKPLEFFLKETFDNWINKVESLYEEEEAQFIFLSKIHFDMRFHTKYDELYHSLEKKYSEKLFNELKNVKTVDAYKSFEKKNLKLINALLEENRNKILERKKKLKTQKKVKWFSGTFLAVASISIIVVGTLAWNAKTFFIKNETELFSDIETEYKTNNYVDALDAIEDYQSIYSNTVNIEHKNRVLEIEGLIKKKQILAEAKQIVNDSSFNDIAKIEKIFTSFLEMGIDNPKLEKALSIKKNKLTFEEEYSEFKSSIEHKNFKDVVSHVEANWKESYGEENYLMLHKILDIKFNDKVEKLLKSISNITDIDEYNNLDKKLNKISSLIKNNVIKKIKYEPSFTPENETHRNKQGEVKKEYEKILKKGLDYLKVSFGTTTSLNEPLGFECGSEDKIILEIDGEVYHFENSNGCENYKISLGDSNQTFTIGRYSVKVTEKDLIDNDHYDKGLFSINRNDLIKLYNGKSVEKDIGNSYFVELGGN